VSEKYIFQNYFITLFHCIYLYISHLLYKMFIVFCFLNMLVLMAHYKTTPLMQVTRVQTRKYREIDWMLERPSKSHDDGRRAGYFPGELRSLLRTLDYHAKPLYVGNKTRLCSKGYKWEVHVVLHKKTNGTGEHRVCKVHHASASRATFTAGIRDAARQPLMGLRH
jgi:hypothetical protein